MFGLLNTNKAIIYAEYSTAHMGSTMQLELDRLAHAAHHVLKEKIYHVQIFVNCKVIAQVIDETVFCAKSLKVSWLPGAS